MKCMSKLCFLVSVVALAGCASPGGGQVSSQPSAAAAARVARAPIQYEHQLVMEYSDGATAFLHLAEVSNP